jgi:UDP-glucose 4-epimerase
MESREFLQSVILVTGAYGLLGSRVVPFLAQNIPGCRIIAVGRTEKLIHANVSNVSATFGDLRDERVWAGLPDSISHVIHLAAVIPRKVEDWYKASLVVDNLLPLAHLIEHSQRWPNLRQIIYSSSVSVYAPTRQLLTEDSPREPANPYGVVKLAGEGLLSCMETRGIRTVSLRLSSLYAYGQHSGTVLPIMVGRARERQPLLVFSDGSRTQDFLPCEDAARAILLSFQKQAHGVYNIGSGIPVSMADLAQTVSRVFAGGMAQVVVQPERPDNDPGIKLDISKARRELNYQPEIQLESGLQKLKVELDAQGKMQEAT